MSPPHPPTHCHMDGEAEHFLQEVVSAVYRASSVLALTLPRDALAGRLQQFIADLEAEAMPQTKEGDHE